ncbi:hypothetical protein [Aliarcobacter butzleri]|uniref:hypothetical protein n=1 Tax=Aliarcobacter butzleri TaxID=28197 RepID=UPI002B246670|nr:hypothetical protein [Aliarcobacter butzleri]
MEVKISKELVSAVLQIDIKDISIIGSTLNYTIPNHETEEDGELVYIDLGQNINIYEFAFKCKEWALDQNCCIRSYILKQEKKGRTKLEYHYLANMPSEVFEEDTEVEAIIKACEWILKEIQI